ncbi:MAG TPA: hypothetical protein VH475_02610 [Tepidisphaeraceae bacterium]
MKRLLRILLNASVILSLLFCLAMAALWLRSERAHDEYARSLLIVWDGQTSKESDQFDWYVGWKDGEFYVARAYERSAFWDGPPEGEHRTEAWTTNAPKSPERIWNLGWNVAQVNSSGTAAGPVLPSVRWSALGAAYVTIPGNFAEVRVPFWLAILISATPIAGWSWRRASVARRRREGLCPSCGYDLRATPDRCPECGLVPGKSN